jgi:competence protein ComEA
MRLAKTFIVLCLGLLLTFPAFAAINLNSATAEELQTIHGIGPKKAQAIIAYRKAHGPFKSIDALDNVPGFGEKTIAKIRSELTLDKSPSNKTAR